MVPGSGFLSFAFAPNNTDQNLWDNYLGLMQVGAAGGGGWNFATYWGGDGNTVSGAARADTMHTYSMTLDTTIPSSYKLKMFVDGTQWGPDQTFNNPLAIHYFGIQSMQTSSTFDNVIMTTIPEPSTMSLVGMATLTGLALLRRRRLFRK